MLKLKGFFNKLEVISNRQLIQRRLNVY